MRYDSSVRWALAPLFLYLAACLAGSYYTVVDNRLPRDEAVSVVLRILRPAVAREEDIRVVELPERRSIRVGYHVVGEVSRDIVVEVYPRSVWVSVHETRDTRGNPRARNPRSFDEARLAALIERAVRAP